MNLLSWVGTADYNAWKTKKTAASGPLMSVASHVKPTRIDILWDDGSVKVPIADAEPYRLWLRQELAAFGVQCQIEVHPCADARVVDFAWVYSQVQRLVGQGGLGEGG